MHLYGVNLCIKVYERKDWDHSLSMYAKFSNKIAIFVPPIRTCTGPELLFLGKFWVPPLPPNPPTQPMGESLTRAKFQSM